MDDFSSCVKCSYETPDLAARFCAQCGGQMQSSKKIRKLGWLAAITGGFLVVLIASVVVWLNVSDGQFVGTRGFAIYAIAMGVLIFTLGVVSILGGAWQIKYGRRNKVLTYATLALGGAIVALAVLDQLKNGD